MPFLATVDAVKMVVHWVLNFDLTSVRAYLTKLYISTHVNWVKQFSLPGQFSFQTQP